MIVRNLLLTMWMAGTLAAQTFIQMSDPRWSLRCAAIAMVIGGAVGASRGTAGEPPSGTAG
jgi:hypothetical protein